MTATDYVQWLWTKTIRVRSVYTEKLLKGLLVEEVKKKICRITCQCWSELQSALLEDLAEIAESFTDIQGSKRRSDNRSDFERAESRREPRRNKRHQRHDQRVMNIENPHRKHLLVYTRIVQHQARNTRHWRLCSRAMSSRLRNQENLTLTKHPI